MSQTSQLDLFATRDEVCKLESENLWLKTRLANAKAEFRKLREELHQQARTATQEQHRLERELRWTRIERDILKMQGEHNVFNQQLAGPNKSELTKLLTLWHPDRWSRGQLATELAHEVTVQLNAWRERLEVQRA